MKTQSSQREARRSTHKIGWLNLPGYKGETWNPIIGCSKVSDGCKNCYAEKMAYRLAHIQATEQDYMGVMETGISKSGILRTEQSWNGKTHLVKSQLDKPLRWKKPRVIFVCSMSDLFHEDTSFEEINAVFSVMRDCDQHIYIVPTKRPERMVEFYNWKSSWGVPWVPKNNVWLGVSAENQQTANERIPQLLKIHAAVRFVSVEPMLGPVDISMWMATGWTEPPYDDVINWVICGGESGHNARPMHTDWARSLRDQCQKAGVPFFFKQWGQLYPACQLQQNDHPEGAYAFPPVEFPSPHNPNKMNRYYKLGKTSFATLLDNEEYQEYPKINL